MRSQHKKKMKRRIYGVVDYNTPAQIWLPLYMKAIGTIQIQ